MKKSIIVVLLALCLGLASTGLAQAAVSGAEPPKCSEPLLITNAGQGPGGKMGRLLVTRSGVVKEVTYNAEPQTEDLETGGFKTMIVVIGSSAKGLGASGITIDQEIARLEKMTTKAKELGIQIIAAHIEGKARRGKAGSADERSIDAILPCASHIIVMKEGDDVDHKFTNFGKEHNIPVTYLDAALDLVEATKAMYPQ
jgi:hypothetical protein